MKTVVGNLEDYYFKFTLSQASSTSLQINYGQSIKYFSSISSTGSSFTIPAGQTEFVQRFNKSSGWGSRTINKFTESFEVTIRNGVGYQVASSPNHQAVVYYRDSEAGDGISIESSGVTAEDKQKVYFQLSAPSISQSDRTIEIYVTDNGHNLINQTYSISHYNPSTRRTTSTSYNMSNNIAEVVLPAGKLSTYFSVRLIDNSIVGDNGFITATILPRTGYKVSPTKNSASIYVEDNDGLPIISIGGFDNPPTYNSRMIEGYSKYYNVYSSTRISSSLTVTVSISGTGNLYFSPRTKVVTISANSTSKYFIVSTYNDNVVNDNRTLTATILPGSGYTVSARYGSSSVAVYDNDAPMEVSIVAETPEITEGQYARFRIVASTPRGVITPIKFSYTGGVGNFIKETPATTTNLSYGYLTTHLYLPTDDDGIDEPDGSLKVTILPNGTKYTVATDVTKKSATVSVLDNDELLVSIAAVTSTASAVDERGMLQMRVQTPNAVTTNLVVEVELTQTSEDYSIDADFIRGDTTRTVTIEARRNSAILTVQLHNDRVDEHDGKVTATLQPKLGYTVDPDPDDNTVTYVVEDNEEEVYLSVSVDRANATVSEALESGETENCATFKLISKASPSGDKVDVLKTVFVMITQGTSNFIDIPTPDDRISPIVFSDNTSMTPPKKVNAYAMNGKEQDICVPLVDNPTYEANGTITAEIYQNSGIGYQLDTANRSASVTVTNDELAPTLSIALNPNQGIREGSIAETGNLAYTISLSGAQFGVAHPITVRVAQSSNDTGVTASFISGVRSNTTTLAVGDNQLNFIANQPSMPLSIDVEDDDIDEADGAITVELVAGTGYGLASGLQPIRVKITDEERDATFGFGAIADEEDLVEGDQIVIPITSSRTASRQLGVRFTDGGRGVIDGNTTDLTAVELADGTTGYDATVVITNGRSGSFPLSTRENEVDEPNHTITATIMSISGVALPNPVVKSIPLTDVDSPRTITIEKHTNEGQEVLSVVEGNSAPFLLRASGKLARTVMVRVHDGAGDFIDGGNLSAVSGVNPAPVYEIPVNFSGTETAILEVPTLDETGATRIDEQDGTITATLQSGTDYIVGSSNFEEVAVTDNDKPVVSIESAVTSVEEGTRLEFAVVFDIGSWQNIRVKVNIAQSTGGGDFINGSDLGTNPRVVNSGDRRKTFNIATIDDQDDEDGASITATVLAGENYQVYDPGEEQNPTKKFAVSIDIVDNDGPVISVSASNSSISEGSVASFVISADKYPTSNRTIKLKVEETKDFLAVGEAGEKMVTLAKGTPTQLANNISFNLPSYDVTTVDDEIYELTGMITLTILAGTGYQLPASGSAKKKSAKIDVTNDEDKPKLSLSVANTSTINEGASREISISITNSKTVNFDLPVHLAITETSASDFVVAETAIATILKGRSSVDYTLQTVQDTFNEDDGDVTVNISANTHYTIVSANEGNPSLPIAVTDDDAVPVISISAVSTPFAEGPEAKALFTLRIETDVTNSITTTESEFSFPVNLKVKDTKDFLADSYDINQVFDFPANEPTGTYEVEIHNDTIDEAASQIKVTILDANSNAVTYIKSADTSKVSATANVTDDDVAPTLKIEGKKSRITEGDSDKNIGFDLRVETSNSLKTTASASLLTVRLRVTESGSGNFIDATREGIQTIQLPANDTNVTYNIPLVANTIDQPNGSVLVELLPDDDDVTTPETYKVTTTTLRDEARVTIRDDDDAPVISVATMVTAVAEGDEIQFKFVATHQAATDRIINYSVYQGERSSDTSDNYESDTVVLAANHTSVTETIEIDEDANTKMTDPIIKVVLQDATTSTDYTVSTTSGDDFALANVIDEQWPELQLAYSNGFTEGTPAAITLEFTAQPTTSLDIQVKFKGITGDFLVGHPEITEPISWTTAMSNRFSYNVPIENDDVVEANGKISVEILQAKGYRLNGFSSREFNINDDDSAPITPPVVPPSGNKPEIQISVWPSTTTTVEEGDDVRLRVLTNRTPPVTVNLADTIAGNFDFKNVLLVPSSVTIPVDARQDSNQLWYQEFEVGIAEDSDFEVDGELGIQIVADATYTIKQSAGSVTLNIIDDDQPTGISIIAADKSIEEGTTARFQIVSHESVSVEREIHLKLVPKGSFTDINNSNNTPTRTLPANQKRVWYNITTDDDQEEENNGNIKVRIKKVKDGSYQRATSADDYQAKIKITDNDASSSPPIIPVPVAESQVLIESHGVDESTLPELSIYPDEMTIIEGELATFTISSNLSTQTDQVIKVLIEQSGDFLVGSMPEEVTLVAGTLIAPLVLPTDDDQFDEEHGTIKATLLPMPEYQISAAYDDASITIEDNDEATISRAELITEANAIIAPSLLQSMSSNWQQTMMNRFASDPQQGTDPVYSINGESTITGILTGVGEVVNDDNLSLRALLDGSSFAISVPRRKSIRGYGINLGTR